MFEIQKSGDKTSSGEIGLDIRTHASPKVGQDQVSGGVSVLCWHAAPVESERYTYMYFFYIGLNSRHDEVKRILSCTCTAVCYILEYIYIR